MMRLLGFELVHPGRAGRPPHPLRRAARLSGKAARQIRIMLAVNRKVLPLAMSRRAFLSPGWFGTETYRRCDQDTWIRPVSAAADGHLELYKTTKRFDADVGREPHGYPPQTELPL